MMLLNIVHSLIQEHRSTMSFLNMGDILARRPSWSQQCYE